MMLKSFFSHPGSPRSRAQWPPGERGYTLFALITAMTIMALILTAAAPTVRQQSQREREQESIFRGEEVAEAIRLYFSYTKRLPTSMEQLKEGVSVPGRTKRVQVLRPSAARDPLSSTGEWRLIRPNSQALLEFQRAVTLYAGGKTPQTSDKELATRFAAQLASIINTGTTESAPGEEDSSENTTGDFIGVASRSRRESAISYYGIDRHDQWVFTPLFR